MDLESGQEILPELLGQLGFDDAPGEIHANTTVIPIMMPYITSQFTRRGLEDRPLVIPEGAQNFAFLGQYVDEKIPPIYHAAAHPSVALKTLKKALLQPLL